MDYSPPEVERCTLDLGCSPLNGATRPLTTYVKYTVRTVRGGSRTPTLAPIRPVSYQLVPQTASKALNQTMADEGASPGESQFLSLQRKDNQSD